MMIGRVEQQKKNMNADHKTMFAPAERADSKEISADVQLLAKVELLHQVGNAVPCIVLILNKQRQVVYRNQRLAEMFRTASDQAVLGKRPGELFECIHADELPNGCGTTKFCCECGAAKAIQKTQSQGVMAVNECRIITKNGDVYDFRVWTSPFHYSDKDFTMFSLMDISDEKRRHVLERMFFHDVNNLLMSIEGYSELLFLRGSKDPEKLSKYIKNINLASRQLCREISSHRTLLQAEKGESAVRISNVNSCLVLDEIIHLFSESKKWGERTIVIDEDSDEVEIATDKTLLFRVIENMVKNAFEATAEGEQVHISCKKSDSSAVFSIHNSGYMPDSVKFQIFQRSFSTKGKGRGIGTYSMKLFGEKYLKGKVWFSSTEDEGTTFYFSLPLTYPYAS